MTDSAMDFVALRHRYDKMEPGPRAEIRRVANPEDLTLVPALYRLFPGQRPQSPHLRLAFILPWCAHAGGAASLGKQLASKKVSEARVLQVARSDTPLDLIQLRRLLVHVEPKVDWDKLGSMLMAWEKPWPKRALVEEFFLAKFSPSKGAKK